MKYNTKSITNIQDIIWTGTYSGVDLEFKPKEIRFLPSFVAEHLAETLIVSLQKNLKGKKMSIDELKTEFLSKILSKEIETADIVKELSLKERILKHEQDYKNYIKQKQQKEIEEKEKLLNEYV